MDKISDVRRSDEKRVWVRPTLYRMDAADAENNVSGPFPDSGQQPMQNS